MDEKLRYRLRKQGFEPLRGPEDTFKFDCPPECWGTCCRSITVRVSPFDVAMMAQELGKSMMQVVTDHCSVHVGKDSRFAVVTLRGAEDGPCEFLDQQGRCGIRSARPSVCRSSPLGRVKSLTGEPVAENLILIYPHPQCQKRGPQAGRRWSAVEFLAEGDVRTWWDGSDSYLDLITWAINDLKFPEWGTETSVQILVNLLYNCDSAVPPGTDIIEALRRSDEATRLYLKYTAGVYGFGPEKDQPVNPAWLVQQATHIMKTGEQPDMSAAGMEGEQ